MKKKALNLIMIFAFILITTNLVQAGGVNDYCAAPPFIKTGNISPNVLIILDTSHSMAYFAYPNRTWDDGTYSGTKYYGYFNSDYWYKYENGEFVPTALKSERKKADDEWDGNFLNWLTMSRMDIARKVLVGGKYKSGYLIAEGGHDGTTLHVKRLVTWDWNNYLNNYAKYVPLKYRPKYTTSGGGNVLYFDFNKKNHQTAFRICKKCDWHDWYGDNCRKCYTDEYHFKVKAKVNEQPEGVLQKVWNKVRLGLMFFNYGSGFENDYKKDGGYIVDYISDPNDNANHSRIVYDINNVYPIAWTPLAESLYEAVRYFEGGQSAYGNISGNYTSPIQYRCQKNFAILITDGESSKDMNIPGGYWNGYYWERPVSDPNGFNIKTWMDKIADNEGTESQYDKLLDPDNSYMDGTYYLEGVAYYAHTNDLRPDLAGSQTLNAFYPIIAAFNPGDANTQKAENLLKMAAKYGSFTDENNNGKPDLQSEWDKNGDGAPDTFFAPKSGNELEKAILQAMGDILKKTTSGTTVAVLSKRTKPRSGSTVGKTGMTVEQCLFYPKKKIDSRELNWTGYVYSWWFLNKRTAQNLREDTNGNKTLDILDDRILEWTIDQDTGKLNINAYSSYSNGTEKELVATYDSFDDLNPLWEAGENLLYTKPEDRKIYTTFGSSLVPFDDSLLHKTLTSYLGNPLSFPACLNNSTDNLINYIRGKDIKGCRSRITDSDNDTWKLGDIIYSSPTIVDYGNYSVVYVGANDGMLHAFKLGYIKKQNDNMHPVKLQDSVSENSTDSLGEELWAFIPQNALPYLRYLADPNYCHMYFVDLRPYIVNLDSDHDGKVDRRILIGGMRLGGATGNGVNPPSDTCLDPSSPTCVGLSSYFALDVTDPKNPKFLWEFTNKDLGFTYSGPAIIKKKTGIYVLFGSGPNDYNGDVNQPLKLFVLDLLTGNLEATYTKVISSIRGSGTGSEIKNAFAGRLFTEGLDYNDDNDTDYLFFGYARKDGNIDNLKGGIIMGDVRSENPSSWNFYTYFNDAIGPVTARVAVGKCFKKYYLYFGTGKWFYKEDNTLSGQRNRIYGVPLECDSTGCRPNVNAAQGSSDVCTDAQNGVLRSWYIELEGNTEDYLKERVITDPTPTKQNAAIFTTIEPSSDPCSFGGRSRVWVLNCATGGSVADECPVYKINKLEGTLLLQLSGADLRQISLYWKNGQDLSKILPKEGNKATNWYTGIAPETMTPFVPPAAGGIIGRLLLWLEY